MTFKQIYEEVIWNLNKTQRGTIPTDAGLIAGAKGWVNSCQREICRQHNFSFLQSTNADIYTVNGTQSYSLPTNFKVFVEKGVIFVDGTTKNTLIRWGEDAENKYPKTDTKGEPTNYWLWEDKIWLYPIPDAVYTIKTKSYNYLPDLSLDGDTNKITLKHYQVLIDGACVKGCLWLQEEASLWEQKYQMGLAEMIRENNRTVNKDKNIIMKIRVR